MASFLSIRLEPEELEDRFRQETLDRDKIQIRVVIALTALTICGFVAIDLGFLPGGLSLYASIASRCAAVAMSLLAIWMVGRPSRARSFDRVVLVWSLIISVHLLIVNAFRPDDWIPVVVWDIVTIFGAYTLLPIPLNLQILSALLLACGSAVIWLVYRHPSWNRFEMVSILIAYVSANIWGIFASWRFGRLHRQQFVVLEQEQKAKQELGSALAEVKVLRGIIPICSHCKKIRNDTGYYEAVDAYISRHSEANFSHTICPDCLAELYPDFSAQMLKEKDPQDMLTGG